MIIHTAGLAKNWTAVPSRQTLEKLKNAGAIDLVFHVGDIGATATSVANQSA